MPSIYYFLTLLGGGGEFTTHTGKQQEMERLHGDIKGKPKGTTRNTNSNHHGFNRKSLGTNRKSIAMNGHRKESTGNQKGWMACAINSERTNILLPVGAGCPLCHLYIIFLTLLGGGVENSVPTQGSNRKSKGFTGTSKGNQKEPQGTPIAIIRKSNGFNRKSLGTNRKSIAMNGHRKESTGNQKGWMACAINSERTNVLLPVGARCPLCHLYTIFLTLLGGRGIHYPHREATGNGKASRGHQRETKRNHKEHQ